MTSTLPNRRYGNGLRRLGARRRRDRYFDEHVEADAVHEQVAVGRHVRVLRAGRAGARRATCCGAPRAASWSIALAGPPCSRPGGRRRRAIPSAAWRDRPAGRARLRPAAEVVDGASRRRGRADGVPGAAVAPRPGRRRRRLARPRSSSGTTAVGRRRHPRPARPVAGAQRQGRRRPHRAAAGALGARGHRRRRRPLRPGALRRRGRPAGRGRPGRAAERLRAAAVARAVGHCPRRCSTGPSPPTTRGRSAIRRSTFRDMGGYDGNVLFENLELMRTVRAPRWPGRPSARCLCRTTSSDGRPLLGSAGPPGLRRHRTALAAGRFPAGAAHRTARRPGRTSAGRRGPVRLRRPGRGRTAPRGRRGALPGPGAGAGTGLGARAVSLLLARVGQAVLLGGVRYGDRRLGLAAHSVRRLRKTALERALVVAGGPEPAAVRAVAEGLERRPAASAQRHGAATGGDLAPVDVGDAEGAAQHERAVGVRRQLRRVVATGRVATVLTGLLVTPGSLPGRAADKRPVSRGPAVTAGPTRRTGSARWRPRCRAACGCCAARRG